MPPITNEDEAVEVIDALDCMPLAITQAAAFIKQRALQYVWGCRGSLPKQPWRYGGDEDREANFDDNIYTLTSFSLVEKSADGHKFEMQCKHGFSKENP